MPWYGWTLETWHVKEARHKGPHIIRFRKYEISRTGKTTETERRFGIVKSWGWPGGWEVVGEWVWGFLLGWLRYSRTQQRWWLHNIVNVINATELYTLKWLILCEFYLNINIMNLSTWKWLLITHLDSTWICRGHTFLWSFPAGANGYKPTCQGRLHKGLRFNPWVGKSPWSKAW